MSGIVRKTVRGAMKECCFSRWLSRKWAPEGCGGRPGSPFRGTGGVVPFCEPDLASRRARSQRQGFVRQPPRNRAVSSSRFSSSSEAAASDQRADRPTSTSVRVKRLDEARNRVRAVAVAEAIVTARFTAQARQSSAEDRCAAGDRARRGTGRPSSALGSPGRPRGGRPRSVPEGRRATGGLPPWRHR